MEVFLKKSLNEKDIKIKNIYDNDRSNVGKIFNGILVKSPVDILNDESIIIASDFYKEITKQLNEIGIKNIYYFPIIYLELYFWNKNKIIPPPAIYKYEVIKEYAKMYGIKTCIETGAYLGDMIENNKCFLKKLYL